MTNDELKEYAAANRSRLEKQEVALGDLVMILVGKFAGEKGVVKGISVCDNDFTDPYYEVDMACEVPDRYKCRKTLVKPNNVIGGLGASDFKVIGNRVLETGTKGAEPKPKFQVGDKVVAIASDENIREGMTGAVTGVGINFVQVRFADIPSELYYVRMDMLSPYTEPTSREGNENEPTRDIDRFIEAYEKTISRKYRMALAVKIAVAYAEKGRYEPSEIGAKAVEVANGVVERLKKTDCNEH